MIKGRQKGETLNVDGEVLMGDRGALKSLENVLKGGRE